VLSATYPDSCAYPFAGPRGMPGAAGYFLSAGRGRTPTCRRFVVSDELSWWDAMRWLSVVLGCSGGSVL